MFRKAKFLTTPVAQAATASTLAMLIFVAVSTQMTAAPANAQVPAGHAIELA